MGGFVEAARMRVNRARGALKAAEEADDVYAATVAADELEDALRLAHEHGVDVEGEQ
ncbi:hypothetical protein [Streptomyces roseoverticillatus]|uniref:Uncharacterized protein n=1 Tax=Streptomyces roseoverticillatus TaxID=66429 RepID=A0ABV3J5Q5_9ACTN